MKERPGGVDRHGGRCVQRTGRGRGGPASEVYDPGNGRRGQGRTELGKTACPGGTGRDATVLPEREVPTLPRDGVRRPTYETPTDGGVGRTVGFGVTSDGKLNVEQKLGKETSYRFEDVINKMIDFERQVFPTKPRLTDTQPW
jgi:hypothetical protein